MNFDKTSTLIKTISIVGLLMLLISIFIYNMWLEVYLKSTNQFISSRQNTNIGTAKLPKKKKENVSPEILRQMRLDVSRKYSQSIFYLKGQELAQFKSIDEEIYDIKGDIPNGKVKFINESQKTYGEEYYRKGKRHGPYIEYFEDGQIKETAEYSYGKKKSFKEYYPNGQTRMIVNLEDAMLFGTDHEVGFGRIYYRDGILMYEWNLTNRDENRYKKAYNIKGELVQTWLYDVNGDLIKTEKHK